MTQFGDQLRRLRLAARLTQAAVAEAIGVSNTYISALESGRKPAPPQALVTALAACLGVEEQVLWNVAVEEREERLRQRIAGVPTSHRVRRPPPATPQPGAAFTDRNAELGAMAHTVEAFRGLTESPKRRKRLAALLEELAKILRDDDA